MAGRRSGRTASTAVGAEAAPTRKAGKRAEPPAPTRACLKLGKTEEFKSGDYVLVKVEGDTNLGVARIKRIRGTSDKAADTEVEIQWYYRPVDTVRGPRPFYGKKEVFKSYFYQWVPAETISCRAHVHALKSYMKLRESEEPTDFFSRWSYNPVTKLLSPPEVQVFCSCAQPFNPDLDYVECGRCSSLFHAECIGIKSKAAAVAAAENGWTCEACGPVRKRLKL